MFCPLSFWLFCFYPWNCIAQFETKIAQLETIEEANLKILHSVSFPIGLQNTHDLYIHSEWISGWLSLNGETEMIPLMTRFNILTGGV